MEFRHPITAVQNIASDQWPADIESVPQWAKFRGRSIEDAERRLVLFTAIRSVSADPVLRQHLALRGTGSMWLGYGHVRCPVDLDFLGLASDSGTFADHMMADLRGRVKSALSAGFRSHFPDFDQRRAHYRDMVHIEVTPTYMPVGLICARFGEGGSEFVLAGELDYLLAEKLFAMVMQVERKKHRPRDPFDVATMLRLHPAKIHPRRIAEYIRVRSIMDQGGKAEISPTTFNRDLKDYARLGYDEIAEIVGPAFIPFEDAWGTTVNLVHDIAREYPHGPS